MSIEIGVASNLPGDDGQRVANALKEEFTELANSIEAIHGKEFADFLVPLVTIKLNTMQLMSIASEGVTEATEPKTVAFLSVLPMVSAAQFTELTINRGKAFVKNNSDHKTIKSMKDFIKISMDSADMLINKMEEYMKGKKA